MHTANSLAFHRTAANPVSLYLIEKRPEPLRPIHGRRGYRRGRGEVA